MSQRRAKKARRYVRELAHTVAKHGAPTDGGRWWLDIRLDWFFSPRERRRAEAVVARRPLGLKYHDPQLWEFENTDLGEAMDLDTAVLITPKPPKETSYVPK